ncbi:MAG TPA: ROK family protein [Anaerolineae bacterium]|nr:ROK family protein [Anaerolineae bacterium]
MEVLGIDVGGSGIKGAPVDIETGLLLEERYRLPTPNPAKPTPVAHTIADIAEHFNWKGGVGCGFPAAIPKGIVLNAANIHKKWIGLNIADFISEIVGLETRVINDADAAGLAEATFGAGKGIKGVVLVVTIGTGLGTALITNGQLLPNTELGHIEFKGREAEKWASDAVRKKEKLSWKEWAKRLNAYLNYLEGLFYPDLIILGGGVSKKHKNFFPYLKLTAQVLPAYLFNEAGIIGAASIYKNTYQGKKIE